MDRWNCANCGLYHQAQFPWQGGEFMVACTGCGQYQTVTVAEGKPPYYGAGFIPVMLVILGIALFFIF